MYGAGRGNGSKIRKEVSVMRFRRRRRRIVRRRGRAGRRRRSSRGIRVGYRF